MANYGIRYLVIGIGTYDDPCTQPDIDAAQKLVEKLIPFQVTPLSNSASDRLTYTLLKEREAPAIALACGHLAAQPPVFRFADDPVDSLEQLAATPRIQIACPYGCGWQDCVVEP